MTDMTDSKQAGDRELLELAAKAAGIDALYWKDGGEPYSSGPGIIYGDNMLWNPLLRDGDALRLAVKLDMEIYQGDNDGACVCAGYWGVSGHGTRRLYCIELTKADPYAATRRAIVRAAASLAKGEGNG